MKGHVFIATDHLEIDKDQYKIFNEYMLRTNVPYGDFTKFFDSPDIWALPGEVFLTVLNGKPYFSASVEFNNPKALFAKIQNDRHLMIWLLFCFWFVKDNSCNVGPLAAMAEPENLCMYLDGNKTYYNASGDLVDTNFNNDEIELGFKYYEKILPIVSKQVKPDPIIALQSGGYATQHFNTVPYNELTRLQRTFVFLTYARSESYVLAKISFYMLVLESLFSANDKQEIQHKIGERVAMYISNDPKERRILYADLKKWYNYRSKFFHGQELEDSESKPKTEQEIKAYFINIKASVVKLDNLVRRILIKIIDNDIATFQLPSKKLSVYFDSLIFGFEVPPEIE